MSPNSNPIKTFSFVFNENKGEKSEYFDEYLISTLTTTIINVMCSVNQKLKTTRLGVWK
jgi:hypothetical protein